MTLIIAEISTKSYIFYGLATKCRISGLEVFCEKVFLEIGQN